MNNCLGPLCPTPPAAPFEGLVKNTPAIFPLVEEEACDIDGTVLNVKCPSFLHIYIMSGYYGRKQNEKKYCTGNPVNTVIRGADCLDYKVLLIILN